MASTRNVLVTSAAVAILAAAGAGIMPATAGAAGLSVGNIFSGMVEATTGDAIVVERRQRNGASLLIGVDTDVDTIVSRNGQQLSLANVKPGAEVIVSGTKTPDGAILASKIVIRA